MSLHLEGDESTAVRRSEARLTGNKYACRGCGTEVAELVGDIYSDHFCAACLDRREQSSNGHARSNGHTRSNGHAP